MKHLLKSLFLHILPLALLLDNSTKTQRTHSQDQGGYHKQDKRYTEVDIVERPKETSGKATQDGDGEAFAKKYLNDCKNYYYGVGVSLMTNHMYDYQVVTAVYSGYPAQQKGLRVGDEILVPSDTLRGEEGKPVSVVYRRNGQIYHTVIIREKICTT